jgi:hypothetical protein
MLFKIFNRALEFARIDVLRLRSSFLPMFSGKYHRRLVGMASAREAGSRDEQQN